MAVFPLPTIRFGPDFGSRNGAPVTRKEGTTLSRRLRKKTKKAGLPPGTLVHIGERKEEKTRISFLYYDADRYETGIVQSLEECPALKDMQPVVWINVVGIHDVATIEQIGVHLGIHGLVLEDILHTGQRPKMEDFGNYLYLVLKMLTYSESLREVQEEQISLLLGPTFVVSFQEKEGDLFDPVRERIKQERGRIRRQGADYLLYALMDSIVDHYFTIMETLGEGIENLEDQLLRNPTNRTLEEIHHLKREMIFVRKAIWPLRDMLGNLERRESSLIQEKTGIYLRDVHDHALRIIDMVETYRDMLTGMIEMYLSSVSNRMNEIMKVLTVIATIFIPLTFIASIYGMNFRFMPELGWHWSYPAVLGVMGIITAGMILFFKRKQWM